MVQAECRERACSSYAEATPIDAERKREPEGPAQRAQQPRSARDRTGARRASAKRAAICVLKHNLAAISAAPNGACGALSLAGSPLLTLHGAGGPGAGGVASL